MEEDDDVRPLLERSRVAGLLIAPVAAVLRVHEDLDPELACKPGGVVRAGIVHQDHRVGDSRGDVGHCLGEGALRAVGGHGDDDSCHGGEEATCYASSSAASSASPTSRNCAYASITVSGSSRIAIFPSCSQMTSLQSLRMALMEWLTMRIVPA